MHQRQVLTLEVVRAELFTAGLVGEGRGQRHGERARGIAIEAVEPPETVATAAAAPPVYSRTRAKHHVLIRRTSWSASRVEPGRLVEDQHVLVLVDHGPGTRPATPPGD